MRIHPSSIATVFVALLFVSGSVGCRSNGGAWYNPKTYSLNLPFAKPESPFSADAFAGKPSIDSVPDIATMPGGYTSVDQGLASRAGFNSTVPGGYPAEYQNSPSSSNHFGSEYSTADPSTYPPVYAAGNSPAAAVQHQYQQDMGHNPVNQTVYQGNQMPGNTTPYGGYGDYPTTGTQQYQTTDFRTPYENNPVMPQPSSAYPMDNNYGAAPSNNYAPFAAPPQNDAFSTIPPASPYGTPPASPYGGTPAAAPTGYGGFEPQPVQSPYPSYPTPPGGYGGF
jgi:hypothetical protein